MRKLILLALICASFTLQAQTYKTVTMALDTPTNVAILRAGVQSLNLNLSYLKRNDTTTYRTVLNSLTRAQTQTALNLKANDNQVVHITGTESITGAKTFSQAVNLQSGYLLSTGGTVNGYSELTPTSFGTQFNTAGLAEQGQFFVDKTGFGTSGTGTNGTGSFLSGGIDSHIDYLTKPGNLKSSIKIDGSGIVVTDAILSKGITLAQDYSANFTNESLVTRRFVTAADALKANDNEVVKLAGTQSITGAKTFTSDVQIPAIPTNATSAASKSYIDNLITGITWKSAVRVATTANITLSGTQTIGGIALVVGDRVLVKNQTSQIDNGIYLVASGAWTRALDADTGTEIETATVAVTLGTVNANTQWTCTATSITIGTTPITFGQISGAGTYSASTGLTLTGNVFAIDGTVATLAGVQTLTNKSISGGQITSVVATATTSTTAGTVTTPAQPNITSVGTLTSLNTTGNIGLGVTPSAWGGFKVAELPNGVFFGSFESATNLFTGTNAYFNGMNWIYKANGAASRYQQSGLGIHIMSRAISGTAGGVITWINDFYFDENGRLGINNTAPTEKLDVIGNGLFSGTLRASNLGAGIAPSASTRLLLAPATVSISSFRMPTGVAPTTPVTGDWWSLGLRTQTFDGVQTKDVLFDKANSVLAGFGVGAVITDNLGNLSVAPSADRTLSNRIVRTTAYTITLADFGANGELILEVNATGGAVTITLPSLAIMSGVRVAVHKTDSSANTVTVSGAVNINGSASLSLTTAFDSRMITGGSAVYLSR